jgi:cytoskeletal protein CcmA (bactofilin family)
MGFFSELKSDLSQAVNTLMPEGKPETEGADNDRIREENKGPVDLGSMLERLDDIRLDEEETESESASQEAEFFDEAEENASVSEKESSFAYNDEPGAEESSKKEEDLEQMIEEQTREEIFDEEPKNAIEAISAANIDDYVAKTNEETEKITKNGGLGTMDFENQTPTDEQAVITEGMVVKGDIATTGSLDLTGKITGNIKCLGKLSVTGEINGNSDAAEVYAESARITGEVKSKGSVKIGQSTVIIGNIFGSSAVIAGAVKGDIDVHGPVVLDTTAIVMGNIKSQSVQINNGAVIEGMCSQSYADVNPSEFFDGIKNK